MNFEFDDQEGVEKRGRREMGMKLVANIQGVKSLAAAIAVDCFSIDKAAMYGYGNGRLCISST